MNDFSYGFSVRKNKFALASKKCRSKCHFYGKCHGSADCTVGGRLKNAIRDFDLICTGKSLEQKMQQLATSTASHPACFFIDITSYIGIAWLVGGVLLSPCGTRVRLSGRET